MTRSDKISEQSRRRWDAMEDRSAHIALYEAWRDAPPKAKQQGYGHAYGGVWGGGIVATPISPVELHKHHEEFWFPPDSEVFCPDEFHVGASDPGLFASHSGYDCWVCPRSSLATCRKTLERPMMFDLTHRGIGNYLERLPRPLASSGSVMLMLQGPSRRDPTQVRRSLVIVSQVTWTPRVWEVALCEFGDVAAGAAAELQVPFECFIRTRAPLCHRPSNHPQLCTRLRATPILKVGRRRGRAERQQSLGEVGWRESVSHNRVAIATQQCTTVAHAILWSRMPE